MIKRKRPQFYRLVGHDAVPCEMLEWSQWLEEYPLERDGGLGRRVGNYITADVQVSTVFLGIDHQFNEDGPVLLFETMVFGGDHDGLQERYSTWEEAEAGHKRAVNMVKGQQ